MAAAGFETDPDASTAVAETMVAEAGPTYGADKDDANFDKADNVRSDQLEAPQDVAVESGAIAIGVRRMKTGMYVHLNGPENGYALRSLARDSLTPEVVYKGVVYHEVSEADAHLYNDWGAPIKPGFLQVANSNEVRHILKQHGDVTYEKQRGQMAITPDDFAKVPEIANPENIMAVTRLKDGRFSVFYQKRVNGYVLLTELIGSQNGQMSLKTLMKKKTEWGTPAVLSNLKAGQVINAQGDRDATPSNMDPEEST